MVLPPSWIDSFKLGFDRKAAASFRAAGTMRVRAFAALLVASCASLIVAEDSGSAGEAQAAAQAASAASAASSSSSSSQKKPIDYGDPGTWRLDDL